MIGKVAVRRPSYGGLNAYSPDCLSYYYADALEGAPRRPVP
jgi:hypothetical protein